MALKWTDPMPPNGKTAFYDHVEAETPLGVIRLNWKSWKDYDSPSGEMPWGDFVIGDTLDEAKAEAQKAWDAKCAEMAQF